MSDIEAKTAQQIQVEAQALVQKFLDENGLQIVIVGIGAKSGQPHDLRDLLPDSIGVRWFAVNANNL